MSKFEQKFTVSKTGPHKYVGNHPLEKSFPASPGVYGGNIAGQALLVAMKSVPDGYTPHSFHSYFVKGCTDKIPVEWTVEEISNGRSFCNRSIRGLQNGRVCYLANFSLARKNSLKDEQLRFDEYQEKKRKEEEERSRSDAADDDDDDDDDDLVEKPFYFQCPLPRWLQTTSVEQLVFNDMAKDRFIYHKIPPQMVLLELTREEENMPPLLREMCYYVRLGNGDIKLPSLQSQFVGLVVTSDSLISTRLARILRITTVDLNDPAHYFAVSLDHVMYFHDTDFDCTEWMGYSFKAVRMQNDRVLMEAQMYNKKGDHVASIFQEVLVQLHGLEATAKL